ncbi:MAG: cache domain-containing protein [Desulfobacterales bacterium]|nr:cache domain-containing protein [Desulfobacterales bacterium]
MTTRPIGSITRVFTLNMIVVATLAVSICGYLWVSMEIRRFREDAVSLREGFLEGQRQILRSEVERAIDFIQYKKSQTENQLKEEIRNRTYEAHAIATHLYNTHGKNRSIAEIEQMVKDALRPIRFSNDRGYYFATGIDGIEQLFAGRPELEGLNLLEMQDTHGKFVIQDMIRIARNNGEGFYEYTWTKPDSQGRHYSKIAFIKYFEPFDWFIGTGEYIDDVTADIQAEVLDRISRRQYGKAGYIFAGQWDGMSLSGPARGKNMGHITDADGVKVVQELIAAARTGGGFVRYTMPELDGKRSAPKLSYTMGIADWQWYVGAGVYLDDIDQIIAERQAIIYSELKQQVLYLVLALVAMLGVIALAASYMAKKTGGNIALFSSFFQDAATTSATIDPNAVHFSEFVQLADSANRMIEARKTAESEKKESEQRFRELAELLPEAIFEMDIQGRLTFVNRKAYDYFGYSSDDLARGLNAFDMIDRKDRQAAMDNIGRITHGEPLGLTEFAALRKDGSRFPAMLHAIAAVSEGRPIGVRGFIIDITDKKNLETQLRQSQKMEAIGTLAGGIAHDFNNILSAILGYTELSLSDATPGSLVQSHLLKIFKAGERARDLVKQILTFSRQADQDKMPMLVGPVVKEAYKLLRASLPTTIDMNLTMDSEPTVMADPSQIHQVIMNLCTNAAHAMRESGGVLDIRLTEETLDEESIARHPGLGQVRVARITVSDTGHGMAPEIMERIFDPFFTTKPKDEGTGMGLSVVHGIVNSHEGAMEINSRPYEGTTFHILLPVIEAKNAGESTTPPALPTGSERILFVDDEEFQVDLGRQMLEKLGYRINTFSESLKALEWFRKNSREIDLVITDMTMPQMTGDALARTLMNIRPDIPVIICTGFSDRISEELSAKLGIEELVMKPIVLRDLAQIVRRVLDRTRPRPQLTEPPPI